MIVLANTVKTNKMRLTERSPPSFLSAVGDSEVAHQLFNSDGLFVHTIVERKVLSAAASKDSVPQAPVSFFSEKDQLFCAPAIEDDALRAINEMSCHPNLL